MKWDKIWKRMKGINLQEEDVEYNFQKEACGIKFPTG